MKNIVTKLKSFPRDTRRDLGNYLIVVAAFLLMQAALGGGLISNSMEGLLVPICAYVVMAISLTLTVGILGELSLGHGGFMSVGAFVGVFFSMATQNSIPSDGMRLFLAFVAGTVAAGVVGLLIGIPVLRLRGDYLAIVTLAFGEIIKNVLNVLYVGVDANGIHVAISDEKALHLAEDGRVIIAGALGISGGRKLATFVIGFVLVLVALFIVQNLVRSRAGRAIMSIRDNRIAAEAMGINVTKYKRCGGRALRTQLLRAAGRQVQLQYVHPGAAVRGAGRHDQPARRDDRGGGADGPARDAARPGGLPHADLRHRADRGDDLQPEPAADPVARPHGGEAAVRSLADLRRLRSGAFRRGAILSALSERTSI